MSAEKMLARRIGNPYSEFRIATLVLALCLFVCWLTPRCLLELHFVGHLLVATDWMTPSSDLDVSILFVICSDIEDEGEIYSISQSIRPARVSVKLATDSSIPAVEQKSVNSQHPTAMTSKLIVPKTPNMDTNTFLSYDALSGTTGNFRHELEPTWRLKPKIELHLQCSKKSRKTWPTWLQLLAILASHWNYQPAFCQLMNCWKRRISRPTCSNVSPWRRLTSWVWAPRIAKISLGYRHLLPRKRTRMTLLAKQLQCWSKKRAFSTCAMKNGSLFLQALHL